MAKRKAIDMNMIFYSHASKTNFHKTEKFCTPGFWNPEMTYFSDICQYQFDSRQSHWYWQKRQMHRAMAWLFCQCKQHRWRKWRKISYTMRKLGNSRTVAVVLLFKCKITNWLRDQLPVGSITQCMFEEHSTVIIITDVTDSNPSLKNAFTLSSNRAGRLQGGRKEMRL